MPSPALDPLLAWYRRSHRAMPWRTNPTPYAVWVSEIMLQQTGVSTVIPYFQRWMARFPTVEALAQADEQDVLSQWQGLGYYRRARNLLAGAKRVAQSGWPKSAQEWEAVPGVGRYTAGAIASIALGQAAPLVDGNVERVYARLTGDAATKPELNKNAWEWATQEIRSESPGDWNQALMELGATLCTPTSPLCGLCPLNQVCVGYQTGAAGTLPTPTAKRAPVKLEFDVLIATQNGRFGLRQIPPGEWWEGMWEFVRIPHSDGVKGQPLKPISHVVTHHKITLYPFLVVNSENPNLTWFTEEELETLPLPAPQRRLLRQAQNTVNPVRLPEKTAAQ